MSKISISDRKKIVIIGADFSDGGMTKYALKKLNEKCVIAIADNNPDKQNKRIGDFFVISVDDVVKKYKADAFYVIATKREHKELEAQLVQANLLREKNYEYINYCDVFNPNEYAYYRRTKIVNKVYYPSRVRLEISSYCNLQCVYCRYHSKYFNELPKGCNSNLSMELIKIIVNEIREMGTIKEIYNVQKGEMFCNPEWYSILNYIRTNLDIERFHFSTNGMLLNRENVDRLIELNFPKLTVVVSLDGTNREENDRRREGSNFEVVKNNILYLLERKNNNIEVLIQNAQMLVKDNLEKYERTGEMVDTNLDFLSKIINAGALVNVYATLTTGDKDVDAKICETENAMIQNVIRSKHLVEGCALPLEELAIDSEGYVVICGCEPWGQLYRVGNIKDEKMIDIWNGEIMSQIRELYRNGNEVPVCKKCISNALSEDGSSIFVRL